MSITKEIERMIFQECIENQVYSTDDFKRMAVEHGIISESNKTAVNNTMFNMRDNPRIEKVGRGKYKVYESGKGKKGVLSTEEAFEYLIVKLKKYQEMNPVKNSKESMILASEEVEKYRNYIQILQNTLQSK